MKTINIIDAQYVGDFTILIEFSDNKKQVVNVGNFIKKKPHPQYNKYLDEKKFKNFNIENGNIVWGKNWDLNFPLEQLYTNSIMQ